MVHDAQAVLLAGGMGKRLGIDTPKCLLGISSNGKTATPLDICMCKLIHNGFRDFVLLLGYKAELVIEHIKSREEYRGLSIEYSIDPEGSIGWGKGKAFKYALMNKKIDASRRALVTFPDDILLDDDIYSELLYEHMGNVRKGVYSTIALVNGIEYPYGTATLQGNMITEFKEKPILNIHTSIGVYAFEPEVYTIIDDLIDMNSSKALELESLLFPRLAEMGRLAAYIIEHDKWLPINTLKDYEKAVSLLYLLYGK